MWSRICAAVNRLITSLDALADSLDAFRLTLDTRTEVLEGDKPEGANDRRSAHSAVNGAPKRTAKASR